MAPQPGGHRRGRAAPGRLGRQRAAPAHPGEAGAAAAADAGRRGAVAELGRLLEADPPYGAAVRFTPDRVLADGWHAPAEEPWLSAAVSGASRARFVGADVSRIGQGGTIPLMGKLSRQFPGAQFLACGVLGPGANAHGPNESLHVPYARRLTASLSLTLNAFAVREAGGGGVGARQTFCFLSDVRWAKTTTLAE
ncbi:hypothetical protein ABZ565_21105 [Streptomyces sp. NPDC016469]|uniref:hypothetical protein n=1 Tax=Streptomyces sp. NPDC016469 TaxID=3157191 RepID=UPI0033F16B19